MTTEEQLNGLMKEIASDTLTLHIKMHALVWLFSEVLQHVQFEIDWDDMASIAELIKEFKEDVWNIHCLANES